MTQHSTQPDASLESVLSGQIRPDPANDVPIGGVLSFEPLTIRADQVAVGLELVKNWTAFDGCLLTILVKNGDESTALGSAVVVAPGVAISAGHVVDHDWHGLGTGERGILCVGPSSNGLDIWRVRHITRLSQADLAILSLVRASPLPNGRLRLAAVTTRVPKEGSRLLVTGFRSDEPATRGADGRWKLRGGVMVAHGDVKQRFMSGRGSMLRSSCLEVDCPAVGGMSGGPVFDSTGQVLGIVSSSLSTEDGTGPSFVTLMWPALVTAFPGGWPAGLFGDPNTLVEMGAGLRFIDNDKCFTRTISPEGEPAWAYDWE
jgi:Trypsin-like peptidase domain